MGNEFSSTDQHKAERAGFLTRFVRNRRGSTAIEFSLALRRPEVQLTQPVDRPTPSPAPPASGQKRRPSCLLWRIFLFALGLTLLVGTLLALASAGH